MTHHIHIDAVILKVIHMYTLKKRPQHGFFWVVCDCIHHLICKKQQDPHNHLQDL